MKIPDAPILDYARPDSESHIRWTVPWRLIGQVALAMTLVALCVAFALFQFRGFVFSD